MKCLPVVDKEQQLFIFPVSRFVFSAPSARLDPFLHACIHSFIKYFFVYSVALFSHLCFLFCFSECFSLVSSQVGLFCDHGWIPKGLVKVRRSINQSRSSAFQTMTCLCRNTSPSTPLPFSKGVHGQCPMTKASNEEYDSPPPLSRASFVSRPTSESSNQTYRPKLSSNHSSAPRIRNGQRISLKGHVVI